ncbi:MAG TPA: hypothetical protein PLU72_03435 [Candidatus Ozemobacteraceae bacterium]|nr:hypothetical protein [Candidatus Ozemobacteraceae bacterium]HQG29168.1 hypothetical protein [Candidatus Ozemobacteraceae bacterium]
MKKYFLTAICIGIVAFAAFFYFGPYKLTNPDYLFWDISGKPCTLPIFEQHIIHDAHRSFLIRGVQETDIRNRFPFLSDGDRFASDSVRGIFLTRLKKFDYKDHDVKLLWYPAEGDWGVALILLDGKGHRFEFYKP